MKRTQYICKKGELMKQKGELKKLSYLAVAALSAILFLVGCGATGSGFLYGPGGKDLNHCPPRRDSMLRGEFSDKTRAGQSTAS